MQLSTYILTFIHRILLAIILVVLESQGHVPIFFYRAESHSGRVRKWFLIVGDAIALLCFVIIHSESFDRHDFESENVIKYLSSGAALTVAVPLLINFCHFDYCQTNHTLKQWLHTYDKYHRNWMNLSRNDSLLPQFICINAILLCIELNTWVSL
jgi:hypothetical protein